MVATAGAGPAVRPRAARPTGGRHRAGAGGVLTSLRKSDGADDRRRGTTAAREYKAIVAEIAAAAEHLRKRDRERAGELARTLVGLTDDMQRAEARAGLTRLGVELHWEAALEALWVESWMKLRPLPRPDPRADPAQLDALDAEVEARAADLQAAVRRRFGLPRR